VWCASRHHFRRSPKGNSLRCYICDVELSEGEINLGRELKSEPCTTCQNIIYETAFSGKFSKNFDGDDDYGDDFEPDDLEFAEMIEEEVYYENNS
jgi:hypothetical protein